MMTMMKHGYKRNNNQQTNVLQKEKIEENIWPNLRKWILANKN